MLQKNGRHSVNFGPIWASLGSKWPQRAGLWFRTVLFFVKMAKNYSKCQIKGPFLIRYFWTSLFQRRFDLLPAIFELKNTASNDRSGLCGHLEPKLAKIGPKLTKWWPFYQTVLQPLLNWGGGGPLSFRTAIWSGFWPITSKLFELQKWYAYH